RGVRPGLRPVHGDRADDLYVTDHRDNDEPSIPEVAGNPAIQLGRILLHVRDVDHGSVEEGTLLGPLGYRSVWKHAAQTSIGVGMRAHDRSEVDLLAVEPSDRAAVRVEKPDRALTNRVEHRCEIGRRAGNDLQDLARRGLLLEGLGEILV